MFSAFLKQARSGTPREYGKHTDITPTCNAPSEQTWLEYKTLTNDQNAFITVYGEKKSVIIKRHAQEKREQDLQDLQGTSPKSGAGKLLNKSASVDLSESTNTEKSAESGAMSKT